MVAVATNDAVQSYGFINEKKRKTYTDKSRVMRLTQLSLVQVKALKELPFIYNTNKSLSFLLLS